MARDFDEPTAFVFAADGRIFVAEKAGRVVGTGAQAAAGNRATVAYTGWLYDSTRTDGKGAQFDSSSNFAFALGAGQVIKGWDQGVVGMRSAGSVDSSFRPILRTAAQDPEV